MWLGLDQASKILGDMASVYFVSVAAIVAAFFGTQAMNVKKIKFISTKNVLNTHMNYYDVLGLQVDCSPKILQKHIPI